MQKGSSFDYFLNLLDPYGYGYDPLIGMDSQSDSLANYNADDWIAGLQSMSIAGDEPTYPFSQSRNLAGLRPNSQSPVLPPFGFDGGIASEMFRNSLALFPSSSNGFDRDPYLGLEAYYPLIPRAQANGNLNLSRGYGSFSLTRDVQVPIPPTPTRSLSYSSFTGEVYSKAKAGEGCGELQRRLDEGEVYVNWIFDGVVEYLAELMKHPIANHLMQKLIGVCSCIQKNEILLRLTENPDTLLSLTLHTIGTRCMQKLVESLENCHQRGLFFAALKPGCRDLIKNHNATSLIRCCIKNFPEYSKFILEAVSNHWDEVATDRHGCYILQNCLKDSNKEFQEIIVPKIMSRGLELAVHASGNYVIQFVLGLKDHVTNAKLAKQFEGYYVSLSTQKISSNVVEKCLMEFREGDKNRIVLELLSFPQFEQLLQHPYANYVIQSAVSYTTGAPHAALVGAIRPHYETLRSSPFSKKLFATLSKRQRAF